MIICKICGKECHDRGIGTHVKNQHSMTPIQYYDTYYGKHKCLVCGKDTNFRSINQGYLEFCSIDFNKNNLIEVIPKPELIFNDSNLHVYGAGKLYEI